MVNIIEIIDNYGISKSNIISHIYRDNRLTYKELTEKSNALAAYIIDKFDNDKTPILIYGHKQNEMLVCFLACIKSGHAYIPIDSSLPKERIMDIIENSKVKLIFSVENLECNLEDVEINQIDDIQESIKKFKNAVLEKKYRIKDEETHYIIYTSGSTGRPKGVEVTNKCLQSFIKWALELYTYDLEKSYVFMNQAPFSFDLSVMDLYISLVTGSTLFSIDKEMTSNIQELFQWLKKSNIDIWVSTPSFAEMCLSDKAFNKEFLNIELFLFCGETLTNECVSKLHERFVNSKVINMYGPTEATVAVTSIEIDKKINNTNPLPVGRVKEDCCIKIVDCNGVELEEGEEGEIIIIGDSVTVGYYKNKELTKKSFFYVTIDGKEKRAYKTGDKGFVKNGILYCLGRIDFQVKMNGFRIELGDIENNFRKISFIENTVVVPVMKNSKIHHLQAFVTLNKVINEKDFKITLMIKEELKKFLPQYMIPRIITILEKLPITVNGKIDRKKLINNI